MLVIKGGATQDDQAVLTEMSKQGRETKECVQSVQVINQRRLPRSIPGRRSTHVAQFPSFFLFCPPVANPVVTTCGIARSGSRGCGGLFRTGLTLITHGHTHVRLLHFRGPDNTFWNVCRRADSSTLTTSFFVTPTYLSSSSTRSRVDRPPRSSGRWAGG
jgi:hypothetical protein